MSNIFDHNNKYLKCVITNSKPKSTTSFEPLGNLTIYNNKVNTNEEYNEIYLGTDFLAAGYGFKNRDDFELKNEQIDINKSNIEDINDDLNNIHSTINNINGLLDKKVNLLIENSDYTKSDISNTYLSFKTKDNKNVYVKVNDFLTYIHDASYNKLQIKSITKTLYVNNLNEPINITSNIVELPIGTKINKLCINIKYDAKDTNGIGSCIFNYYYQGTNNENINNTITWTEASTTQIGEGEINLNIFYTNTNQFYVTNELSPLVTNIILFINGTPISKYKNYNIDDEHLDIIKFNGDITNEDVIQIQSTKNIIYDYQEQLDCDVYIKGVDIYGFGKSDTTTTINITSPNIIINSNNTIVQNINNDPYYILTLPSNYQLYKANVFINNASYNIKGYIYKYKDIYYQKINNKYIPYNVYVINNEELSNNVMNSMSKELYITISKLSDIITVDSTNNITSFVYNESNLIRLHDEDFDTLYWVDGIYNWHYNYPDTDNNNDDLKKYYIKNNN